MGNGPVGGAKAVGREVVLRPDALKELEHGGQVYRTSRIKPRLVQAPARMRVRTPRAMAMMRWRRSSVMIVVMCSSLISLTVFLPMAGKMWSLRPPLSPEIDLVTHSRDLNANHCLATGRCG